MSDEMELIAARLRLRRMEIEKSLQEVADAAGITKSTLQRYEKESIRNLPLNKLADLARALDTSPEWILGWTKDVLPTTSHTHWVPVLGRVAAGIPAEMVEDILGYEEIDDSVGEAFALRINGDSMAPSLMKGDVVIVKRQEDVESGDVAIVAVNGEDATCKRIVKSSDGVMLVPINPEYPPIFYSNDEILSAPITILGKVVELRRSF